MELICNNQMNQYTTIFVAAYSIRYESAGAVGEWGIGSLFIRLSEMVVTVEMVVGDAKICCFLHASSHNKYKANYVKYTRNKQHCLRKTESFTQVVCD